MATHDYVIANGTGAAVRSDLNDALAAIVSNNSSSTAPATTYAYQWWADTTTGLLKQRNAANNAWITIGTLASTNLGLLPVAGGTMTGVLAVTAGTAALPGITPSGDPNTGISSSGSDQLTISTGGTSRVAFSNSEVVLNDEGADVDFRVEGDTKANLLLVDAGADTVSIDGTQQLANQTPLRFGDSDNSHYVALRSPATVSTNVTWDLPATDGTVDQVLKTNGSGVLGWSSGANFASTSEVSGTHTTGTVTSGSASLTVASATGITSGMFIVGEGIVPGTTVSSIASTTVTMSANAGATLSSDPVAFYIANKSLSPGLVAGQLCRAWVNFNGTGTVAIRASYNVSSITDNGTGDYTVNFTTAMPDANYSAVGTSKDDGTGSYIPFITSQATSNVRIGTKSQSAVNDTGIVCIAIFR